MALCRRFQFSSKALTVIDAHPIMISVTSQLSAEISRSTPVSADRSVLSMQAHEM